MRRTRGGVHRVKHLRKKRDDLQVKRVGETYYFSSEGGGHFVVEKTK